jgi:beta-lactamase regulating signal transducer with metallopeptidase domain
MTSVLAALVNGAIPGALVTATVWLFLRLTPRRALNAATRYAVWWAVLAVIVTLPWNPFPIACRATSHSVHSPAKIPDSIAAPPIQQSVNSGEAQLPSDAPISRPLFPVEITGGRLARWIAIAWLLATVLMLVRLTVSFVLLEHRKARAFDVPAPLGARLEEWLSRCESTRRHIRLAASAEISAPMVVGPFGPSILLPARLLEQLGESELDQIGLHEAAHLARRRLCADLPARPGGAVRIPSGGALDRQTDRSGARNRLRRLCGRGYRTAAAVCHMSHARGRADWRRARLAGRCRRHRRALAPGDQSGNAAG